MPLMMPIDNRHLRSTLAITWPQGALLWVGSLKVPTLVDGVVGGLQTPLDLRWNPNRTTKPGKLKKWVKIIIVSGI